MADISVQNSDTIRQLDKTCRSYSAPIGKSYRHRAQETADPRVSTALKSTRLKETKSSWNAAWDYTGRFLGHPLNRLAGRTGVEGVWPDSMAREIDKAARLLCVMSGLSLYLPNIPDKYPALKTQPILHKIPPGVLREAQGLAFFTVFRTGTHFFSGSAGSGLLISRLPDRSWSDPSGLLIHTRGVGLLIGIDVYDCILVLRTRAAVESFARPRLNLGAEWAVSAGPVGSGASINVQPKEELPCYAYTKSKGLFIDAQVDGTVILQRSDENRRAYGYEVQAAQIITGDARLPDQSLMTSFKQVLSAAETRQI